MKKPTTILLEKWRILLSHFNPLQRILLLLLIMLNVNEANAQIETDNPDSIEITLNYTNVKIEFLLDVIEEKTIYNFIYNEELIDVNKKASINCTKANINEALTQILSGTNVVFQVKGSRIVLSPKYLNSPALETKKISGTVRDESNVSIPGVSIRLQGTTTGTTTDIEGRYSLSGVHEGDVILYTFIGMAPKEVLVDSRNEYNIVLKEDAISLVEFVAIGYGVQKRSTVTGSISSVKSEDLPKTANTSVTHMLSGKASGVQIRQVSAQPGGGIEITIRGSGSVNAGNEPLYVIDGFPVNNNSVEPESGTRYNMGSRNPLNSINPNDIESIEILKDAASTAIYGARAANGVILITTKKGKEGKTIVDASVNQSVQQISRYFDMLDAKGFMEQVNVLGKEYYIISKNQYPYGSEEQDLSGFTPRFTESQIANARKGTDWWDEVTRLGLISEFNLSVSGGSKKTSFLVSTNYFDQLGVVFNSDFKRFSSRVNIDHTISKVVKFGLSLTGSYIENNNTQIGNGQWENSGVLVSALQMSPLMSIYNSFGDYAINPKDPVLPNPVSFKDIQDNTINKRLLANTFVELRPLENLIFKINVGVDDKSGVRSNYLPNTFLYGAQYQGMANKAFQNSTDLLMNTTVQYLKTFSKSHNFSALIGYEYQEFLGDGFTAKGTKFFTDVMGSDNLGASEGRPEVSSYRNKGELSSYFSRISYDFKEKYLFNITLRADGSSNFGIGNKWGYFPSAAFAWRLSEEEFMSSLNKLSNLKLRISLGQTGNSGIGDGAFTYYGPHGQFMFGNSVVKPVTITQIGNENLKWETTTEFNVGADFGFFKNRIYGTLEYYNKTVDDLLAFRQLNSYSLLSTVADNIGATKLSGLEFELATVNLTGQLKWTTNFNISYYSDKWKERNPDVVLSPWIGENDPIRSIYGYQSDGIVQIGQTVPHMPDALPGNIIYKDLNGFDENNKLTGKPDGIINNADNVYLGSWDPGFSFGIGNAFEYRDFELSFFFYGMADRVLSNPNTFKYKLDAWRLPNNDNNMMEEVSELFRSDKPSKDTPGMAVNPYQGNSDYYLEDASFIRLKNVTLGYILPKRWFKEKMDVRVFLDAQNLLLITNYTGIDPETDGMGAYPNVKTFSTGLNVKF